VTVLFNLAVTNSAVESARNRELGEYLDEVVGTWRKMRNEEVHNFTFRQKIIMVIKSTIV
jgi:hypothetical protein